ncbi:sperm-associated microtubule inner protein 4 [Antennarius striatus]|uniref:sperm-associated microtubule inner protein 4 n=1 Tax=Antennarius striatus TaxID=241820 RepID=UPI0035ADB2A7
MDQEKNQSNWLPCQRSSSQMESDSSQNHKTLNPCSCRAVVTSQHLTNNRHYSGRKKSRVRLNDQLIPKPTDVNMLEKMIKIAAPKEHPYSSHISQFAMFPSFQSPDDPQTGVRATSQPFLNALIPKSGPRVTLLSKTMGNPYRHEVLETKTSKEKKALLWTGEHSFFDVSNEST